MNLNRFRFTVVGYSLFIGMLHFVIGPAYNGPFKPFVNGYLMDILLPANVYLLIQLALNDKIILKHSRLTGVLLTFIIGLTVECLQKFGFPIFGKTYDPIDILCYAFGTVLGYTADISFLRKNHMFK